MDGCFGGGPKRWGGSRWCHYDVCSGFNVIPPMQGVRVRLSVWGEAKRHLIGTIKTDEVTRKRCAGLSIVIKLPSRPVVCLTNAEFVRRNSSCSTTCAHAYVIIPGLTALGMRVAISICYAQARCWVRLVVKCWCRRRRSLCPRDNMTSRTFTPAKSHPSALAHAQYTTSHDPSAHARITISSGRCACAFVLRTYTHALCTPPNRGQTRTPPPITISQSRKYIRYA